MNSDKQTAIVGRHDSITYHGGVMVRGKKGGRLTVTGKGGLLHRIIAPRMKELGQPDNNSRIGRHDSIAYHGGVMIRGIKGG